MFDDEDALLGIPLEASSLFKRRALSLYALIFEDIVYNRGAQHIFWPRGPNENTQITRG